MEIVFVLVMMGFLVWYIRTAIELRRQDRELREQWDELHKRMSENTKKWYGD